MIKVQYTANIDAILDKVNYAEEVMSDLRPCWRAIGKLWAAREKEIFATGGWGRWPALSRKAMVKDPGWLQESDNLITRLTDTTPRSSGKMFAAFGSHKSPPKARGTQVQVGTLHANGTSRMPRRNPVPNLRVAERKAWMRVIEDYIGREIE